MVIGLIAGFAALWGLANQANAQRSQNEQFGRRAEDDLAQAGFKKDLDLAGLDEQDASNKLQLDVGGLNISKSFTETQATRENVLKRYRQTRSALLNEIDASERNTGGFFSKTLGKMFR